MLKSLHRKATQEIAWNSKRPLGPIFGRMIMLVVVVVVVLDMLTISVWSTLVIYSVRVLHSAESYSSS
jgi:hypothetical protein